MTQRFFVFVTALVLLNASNVIGASINIVPTGKDTFAIQGSGLEKVTALDITLGYDAKLLTNPNIARGNLVEGGMLAQNLGQPGTARLGIINPQPEGVSGSGTIATVQFTRKGGAGGILFLNASIVGADGKTASTSQDEPSPSIEEATASSTPPAGQNEPQQQALSGLTVAVGTAPTGAAADVRASGESAVEEAEEEPPAQEEERGREVASAPAPAAERTAPAQKQKSLYTRREGVADRFRLYTGPRTPEALAALFDAKGEEIRQEPPVCLSDGVATMTVRVHVAPSGGSPNFSLTGAHLISLKREGEWYVVEARPEREGWNAVLVLKQDEAVTEIPLTVAPALSPSVTREAFAAWLRSNPRQEGEKGWVDDYIRTANYRYGGAGAAKKEGTASR